MKDKENITQENMVQFSLVFRKINRAKLIKMFLKPINFLCDINTFLRIVNKLFDLYKNKYTFSLTLK